MPSFAVSLKRSVWIASGSVTGGVRQFGEPVLHKWNVRILNVNVGLMAFGPNYMDYRSAVTTNDEIGSVVALDRVWLDRVPNDTTDPLARTADFYVLGVTPGAGGVAQVTFKRLSEDGIEDTVS